MTLLTAPRLIAAALALEALALAWTARADNGGPPPGDTAPAPPLFKPIVPPDGAAIFARRCAGCHAADGSGETHRAGRHLPDFRRPRWQERHDLARVESIVHDGLRADHMPAFGDRLSAEEIAAVASFVKGLQPAAEPDAGPAPSAAPAPTRSRPLQ